MESSMGRKSVFCFVQKNCIKHKIVLHSTALKKQKMFYIIELLGGANVHRSQEMVDQLVQEAFEKFDANFSGSLDREQFSEFMKSIPKFVNMLDSRLDSFVYTRHSKAVPGSPSRNCCVFSILLNSKIKATFLLTCIIF
jgi:hypothetical protein